jgi:hypothetical protein
MSHSTSKCKCPLCDDKRLCRRVAKLMRSLPVDQLKRFSLSLLQPFLLSLSQMFPVAFPSSWVLHPPVGAQCFGFMDESRSLRVMFLEMCVLVSNLGKECRHPSASSCVDVSRVVESVAMGGESIYSRLFARKRRFWSRVEGYQCSGISNYRVCVIRVLAQIEEIRGMDTVFLRLKAQLEDIRCNRQTTYSPLGLCRFACSVGLVGRMRQMAVAFRDVCVLKKRGVAYLNELILRLDALVESEREIGLAVAMALHPRLGQSSALAVLGCDLLPLCLPVVVCSPIGSWRLLMDG